MGDTVTLATANRCPKGGVLSPLLWSIVIDDLLTRLNNSGYFTAGYADDIVIIVEGKLAEVISDLSQNALNMALNAKKAAIVPFTKQRKLMERKQLKLFGKDVPLLTEVKYLGVTLDRRKI